MRHAVGEVAFFDPDGRPILFEPDDHGQHDYVALRISHARRLPFLDLLVSGFVRVVRPGLYAVDVWSRVSAAAKDAVMLHTLAAGLRAAIIDQGRHVPWQNRALTVEYDVPDERGNPFDFGYTDLPTAPPYLYHGTTTWFLGDIRESGLRTSLQTRVWPEWVRSGYDEPLEGRIFFSADFDGAVEWAREAADRFRGEPVVLRIPAGFSGPVSTVMHDEVSFSPRDVFVENDIPPDVIEWSPLSGESWRPLVP